VVLLASPKHPAELAVVETQMALLKAIVGGLGYAGERTTLIATEDPDVLSDALYGYIATPLLNARDLNHRGTKRDLTRTVMSALHEAAPTPVDWLPLPPASPYGRLQIQTSGCTLCLACVGACPTNALADHPERPQLSFTQAACVQCGICVATCPEQVIRLEPGYDFTTRALSPSIAHAEEPFRCVSCDKPFGTKSTINKVVAKLKGRHAMFQNEAQLRLIQMCDTCRVVAVSESGNDPMRVGERPRVRTTADYLDDAKQTKPKKTSDDFLS
jgi:ferredoxin